MLQGKVIIVTAPSGSGKTTLVKRLMDANKDVAFSISACTRSPRIGEVNGKDYHFFSVDEFKKMIASGEFIEWEMVYEGKYYGTLKSELDKIWSAGKTPIVDIDVKGALTIQEKYPDNSLSIFIQAPSIDVLRDRLQKRGTETNESLEERINKAVYELGFAQQFNKIIINDNLDVAAQQLIDATNRFLGH